MKKLYSKKDKYLSTYNWGTKASRKTYLYTFREKKLPQHERQDDHVRQDDTSKLVLI